MSNSTPMSKKRSFRSFLHTSCICLLLLLGAFAFLHPVAHAASVSKGHHHTLAVHPGALPNGVSGCYDATLAAAQASSGGFTVYVEIDAFYNNTTDIYCNKVDTYTSITVPAHSGASSAGSYAQDSVTGRIATGGISILSANSVKTYSFFSALLSTNATARVEGTSYTNFANAVIANTTFQTP